MKPSLFAIILLLTSTSSAAETPDPTCLSDNEFANVLIVIAPATLKVMGEQCATTLPAGQVLGNPNSSMARNFDMASRAAWPTVYSSFIRVMKTQSKEISANDSVMTKEKFDALIIPMFGKIIKNPDVCKSVDQILAMAEPLPPKNLAEMFVQMAHIRPNAQKDLRFLCSSKH